MRGWMLQNTCTSPVLVSAYPFASPRPYNPRSNRLRSPAENTLWLKGSWFGNRTVEPCGTTTTRGTNSLSLIATSTDMGRAAGPAPSRWTTAAPRSRGGLPPFSRMLIRPATPTPTAPPRGPGRHAAMQLATTKRAILRIARPVPVCVRGSAAYCKAAKIARSARDGGPTKAAGFLKDPAHRGAPPRQLHRRAERVGGEIGRAHV